MNHVILTGRLGTDPEYKVLGDGFLCCMFKVGVRRTRKERDGQYKTDWFHIVAWRHTAEYCRRNIAKGTLVMIDGHIQTRSYETKDGSKRYVTEVIADGVELGEGRHNVIERALEAQDEDYEPNGFVEVEDDQLPF